MPLLTALWSELQGAGLWLAYRRQRQCKPVRPAGTCVCVHVCVRGFFYCYFVPFVFYLSGPYYYPSLFLLACTQTCTHTLVTHTHTLVNILDIAVPFDFCG